MQMYGLPENNPDGNINNDDQMYEGSNDNLKIIKLP
jgi:hypothetical protein